MYLALPMVLWSVKALQLKWQRALSVCLAQVLGLHSLVLLAHLIETHTLTEQPIDTLVQPDTSPWHRQRRV